MEKLPSALIYAKPKPKVITFTLCFSGGFLIYALGWLLKSSSILGFNLGKDNNVFVLWLSCPLIHVVGIRLSQLQICSSICVANELMFIWLTQERRKET